MTEYKCAMCEGIFDNGLAENIEDKEGLAELKENFGDGFKREDCDVVCDDCYEKMFPLFPQAIEAEKQK